MHWSMKEILFFLSIILFVSCESNQTIDKPEEFDLVKHLDSIFVLAHNWSGDEPPVPNELLDIINANMDSVEIYHFDNDIEPQSILFTAFKKSQLEFLEETPTLQRLNKVSYDSYDVWRSIIEGKQILEFSLQPHPTKKWTFSIRKRSQE
jgi:hypothetical protein